MNTKEQLQDLLRQWSIHSSKMWQEGFNEKRTIELKSIRDELLTMGVTEIVIEGFKEKSMDISYKYRGNNIRETMSIEE